MQHMFPRITQCPSSGREGTLISPTGGAYCKKCMHFGEIDKNDSTNSSLWVINKPCTVCAMQNNGFWGWDSEENFGKEDHLMNQNGVLPGKCGIMDTIIGAYNMIDVGASDEQIILGFVQYALYNHLRWNEIIQPSSTMTPSLRESLTHYQVKWSAFDTTQIEDESETDDIWYWWKMIPKGVVLPERLHQKLQLMIVKYPDRDHENCVPKTRQKIINGEVSDDVWTTFWDTYVEPAHVVHIFEQVLITTLENMMEPNNPNSSPRTTFSDYSIHRISTQTELETIGLGIDENEYQWMLEICGNWQRTTTFYLYNGRYPIISENVIPLPEGPGVRSVIKILDRNIFGTYLSDVTYYNMELERVWNSESNFRQRIFPTHVYEQDTTIVSDYEKLRLWNIDSLMMLNGLLYDANSYIGFQKTNYWETTVRELPVSQMNSYVYSDYSNENLFRLVENSEILALNEIAAQNHLVGEHLYDPEEVIHKLKELQTMIDEKVKENIQEGVYLDLVNKTYEIYKLIK